MSNQNNNQNSNHEVVGALLGIHALTSMHPGAGSALGTVDLPVQRERHTLWPIIPGSALKGILRDKCREKTKHKEEHGKNRTKANNDTELVDAFGPANPDQDTAHAGALAVTDARILAFPVRSLKGVFAWVTCPGVLERFQRDLDLGKAKYQFNISKPTEKGVATPDTDCPLCIDKKNIVLEEFDFTVEGQPGAAASVALYIADHFVEKGTQERIKKNLVIIHDDMFTHFVRHATEIMARIALDYEKKTVKSGALFYQEFLPPETLFYSVVLANPSRNGTKNTGQKTLKYLEDNLKDNLTDKQGCSCILQIGGDETTGKGLCAIKLSPAERKTNHEQ